MERAIAYLTDVKDLSELLDGATIDQVRTTSTPSGAEVILELTRGMLERQTVVRQGLFRRAKMPWTKCRLTLQGAKELVVQRATDVPPDQPLINCEAVLGGYHCTVQGTDGLFLSFKLDQLQGLFTDVGSPIESP